MNRKIKNLLVNFGDGIYTGLDPLTVTFGDIFKRKFPNSYLSRDRGFFIGYTADTYGSCFDEKSGERISKDIKKERSVLENIAQCVGIGIMLPLSPISELIIVDYIVAHFTGKNCHPEERYEKKD